MPKAGAQETLSSVVCWLEMVLMVNYSFVGGHKAEAQRSHNLPRIVVKYDDWKQKP